VLESADCRADDDDDDDNMDEDGTKGIDRDSTRTTKKAIHCVRTHISENENFIVSCQDS